jgi:hypothetical protein
MANLPDGGLVVLGVEDRTNKIIGLEPTSLTHWADRDYVRSKVNAFLNPAVELEVHSVGTCVVLEVSPFIRAPIVARKDGGGSEISEGALYYRASHVTSSAPIARLEDWNELLETLQLRVQENIRRQDQRQERIRRQAEEEAIRERRKSLKEAVLPVPFFDKPNKTGIGSLFGRNFRLFQLRSMQSEVKANLRAVHVAMMAYRQEKGKYPRELGIADFSPEPLGNYVYRAVSGEIVGAEHRHDRTDLVADGLKLLEKYGAEPFIGENTYLVMGVTRFQPENLLDVWIIDRFGEPRCLTPETTDIEARRQKARWEALSSSLVDGDVMDAKP